MPWRTGRSRSRSPRRRRRRRAPRPGEALVARLQAGAAVAALTRARPGRRGARRARAARGRLRRLRVPRRERRLPVPAGRVRRHGHRHVRERRPGRHPQEDCVRDRRAARVHEHHVRQHDVHPRRVLRLRRRRVQGEEHVRHLVLRHRRDVRAAGQLHGVRRHRRHAHVPLERQRVRAGRRRRPARRPGVAGAVLADRRADRAATAAARRAAAAAPTTRRSAAATTTTTTARRRATASLEGEGDRWRRAAGGSEKKGAPRSAPPACSQGDAWFGPGLCVSLFESAGRRGRAGGTNPPSFGRCTFSPTPSV